MALRPVILADGITTATTGPAVGLRGERIQLSPGASEKQRYPFPIETFTAFKGAAGSTATVIIRVSPDASSWTTWATLSFLIAANGAPVALNRVGKLPSTMDYIQINVTAIAGAGATVNGYVERKG